MNNESNQIVINALMRKIEHASQTGDDLASRIKSLDRELECLRIHSKFYFDMKTLSERIDASVKKGGRADINICLEIADRVWEEFHIGKTAP